MWEYMHTLESLAVLGGGAIRFVLVIPDILHSGLNCVVVSCFGLGTFFCSEKKKQKNKNIILSNN